MKLKILSALLLVLTFTVSSCGNAATTVPSTLPAKPPTVEDQASFLAALQASNAKVETGDSVTQVFFSPEGRIVTVNGQDIQVFEYEGAEAMESEASQVAPDGGSIGTSMMMWMDVPHFYKVGRIIILYIGSDDQTLTLLQSIMGAQFAGR
jgi:hypothetical protein